MDSTPFNTPDDILHPLENPSLAPLQAVRSWINWKPEAGANGKTLKIPSDGSNRINPHILNNHRSYQEVMQRRSEVLGVGFVTTFTDDFVCIDIDGCVDEHGVLNARALDMLERFRTYAEYSPSRRGLHLWFSVRNKKSPEMQALLANKRIAGVEVYGYKQFITVTNDPIPGTISSVNNCTEALLELWSDNRVQYVERTGEALDWHAQPVTLKSSEEVLASVYAGSNGERFRVLHETGDAALAEFALNDQGQPDQSQAEAFYIHNALEHADEDPRMALDLYMSSALLRDKSSDARGNQSYAEYSITRILARRLAQQNTAGAVAVGGLAEWPDAPAELTTQDRTFATVPHLEPAELLPEVLATYVSDEAERLNVYPEAIAVSLIAALGITVGCQIAVKPKAKDEWLEYPNLWGFVAAPPGSRKSEAIRSGFAGLRSLALLEEQRYASLKSQYAREKEQHREQKAKLTKDIAALESKREKPAKTGSAPQALGEGDAPDDDQRLAELKAALEGLVEPQPPIERRLYTQDATPEALLELAADNPNGILVLRDELDGIYANLGKSGRENERSIFLEGWDAKSAYRTDRITRDAKPVQRLALSVFGGTQPGVLKAHVSSAYGYGKSADGFMQRFQLAVINDNAPPYRLVDQEPNECAQQRLTHIFHVLHEGNVQRFGAQSDARGNQTLRFSSEAQSVFLTWLESNAHHVESLNAEGDEALASHFAKYPKLVAGLALLFHLCELVTQLPRMEGIRFVDDGDISALSAFRLQGISLNALGFALRWGEFLAQHARAIYAVHAGGTESRGLALKLVEWFDTGKLTSGITLRDLRRKLGRVNTTALNDALEELAEKGWLRVQAERKPHGRPTVKIVLHPEFERFARRRG